MLAVGINALDPSRVYRIDSIKFSGNQNFSDSELQSALSLKTRPFYAIWQKRPAFDSMTLNSDLDQLRLFYEAHGYYDAHVSCDLELHGDLVTPHITINEGPPIKVDTVSVEVVKPGPAPRTLEPGLSLPLKSGKVFNQADYQASEQKLLQVYRQNGFAHPEVDRHAVVKTGPRLAKTWYRVVPHGRGVFGRTSVIGTHNVNPRIVLRELAYQAGQPFDIRKIEQSRVNILNLNLFSAVEFATPEDRHNPHVVPITVTVQEKARRSLTLALGYNTETLLNAQLGWNNYNFLGDGRQLLITGTYSQIVTALDLKLIQPHFFSRNSRLILEASQAQDSYQTYLLNASRFDPHIDYIFTPALTASLGYRLEYLKFNQVNPTTSRAIGGFRRDGILSGPDASVIFNNTSDLLDPQSGEILSLGSNFSDHGLGADYRYWRVQGEARKYQPLGEKTILATRLKLGLEDTLNGKIDDVPLSERFYSGGEGSVRGYGLRRIGPLSLSNDPLGGLSLVEGSIELRHPLVWKLSGAIFFDCGQVSIHSFDIPVDALQCGYGPAVSLNTPVGPARVDIGFPTKTPRGDANYQFYFSIGQFF
ncbi:MAG TPA: BamA/TamA family outer membrane protein [Candidatus Binataceae bacterium]|nr:BamA/TamA family outer membrane protein [Candidatus Binataceae bacterium]